MTPEVEQAIAEIKQALPGYPIDVEPETQGGAYVIVRNLVIGEKYISSISWVGFLIGFQCPHADVYPHFIDGSLQQADGQRSGAGFSGSTTWQNQKAIQVSRRSLRLNPGIDTAVTKLTKVLS